MLLVLREEVQQGTVRAQLEHDAEFVRALVPYSAVQANEVPVEYVVFPDEGHGFRKRENWIAASEAYIQFLNTYLGAAD